MSMMLMLTYAVAMFSCWKNKRRVWDVINNNINSPRIRFEHQTILIPKLDILEGGTSFSKPCKFNDEFQIFHFIGQSTTNNNKLYFGCRPPVSLNLTSEGLYKSFGNISIVNTQVSSENWNWKQKINRKSISNLIQRICGRLFKPIDVCHWEYAWFNCSPETAQHDTVAIRFLRICFR